ncbi:MAG: hypothetical protein DRI86_00220 [Bacteroidetes bacterium]|nr:MAG: hypothetical protein DRI86_00220 [Bacteroidota bacterium]
MRKFIIVLLLLMISSILYSQNDDKKWSLCGYTSFMNTNSFDSISNKWLIDNQLHNRTNFNYFFNNNLTFTAQLRTRFIYGNSVLLIPNYDIMIETETGYLNMNKNIISEQNFLLNINMDRLFFKYTKGDWDISLGRQRINWGRTLIWNPNDIFNTYSYFDFDYTEKPGSDALRVQYYTGAASSIELASSVNYEKRLTTAAKLLVNKWSYDWQFIIGEMEQRDYIAGFGWAGALKSIGFRGEATYFHPIDANDTTREASISATASFDYTFKNSLNIMAQVLYTKITKDNPISDFSTFYSSNLNAKYLSFSPWNMFINAKYPITPLLNISLGGMYYPDANSVFINPSIDYSLSDNLEFSFVYQYFKGNTTDPITGSSVKKQFNFAFLRLKLSY